MFCAKCWKNIPDARKKQFWCKDCEIKLFGAEQMECSFTNCTEEISSNLINPYCMEHINSCRFDSCTERISWERVSIGLCPQHEGKKCLVSYCSKEKNFGDYCSQHYRVCIQKNCSKYISNSEQVCSFHQYMTCQTQNCNTKIGKPEEVERISCWGGFHGIRTEEDKQNFYRREEALERCCLDHKINFALRGCQDLTC